MKLYAEGVCNDTVLAFYPTKCSQPPYYYLESSLPSHTSNHSLYQHEPGLLNMYYDATIWNPGGLFTYVHNTHVYTVITRCCGGGSMIPNIPPIPPHLNNISILTIPRAILVTSNKYASGYYHQIVDKIFPLALARDIFTKYPNTVIIADFITEHMKDYIALLNLSHINITTIQPHIPIKVIELYIPLGSQRDNIPSGTLISTMDT